MRTKTPAEHEAEYTWLTPKEVGPMIGWLEEKVRELIRDGHLEGIDVARGQRPAYRVSPEAVARFLEESRQKVLDAAS